MNMVLSGFRAVAESPIRFGSALVSDRVFSPPQMPIEQSIFSPSNVEIGFTNASCASEPSLSMISPSSSGPIRTIGFPPALITER